MLIHCKIYILMHTFYHNYWCDHGANLMCLSHCSVCRVRYSIGVGMGELLIYIQRMTTSMFSNGLAGIHENELPGWASVVKKVILVQPSSAASERVAIITEFV